MLSDRTFQSHAVVLTFRPDALPSSDPERRAGEGQLRSIAGLVETGCSDTISNLPIAGHRNSWQSTSLFAAVARSVLVVPDGQAVPVAGSGTLGAGTITSTVNFPAAAGGGTRAAHSNVYPALPIAVLMGGQLLRGPSGASSRHSTAWPNWLVTAYLKQTKRSSGSPAQAESLCRGYSACHFEHAGGGYSCSASKIGAVLW